MSAGITEPYDAIEAKLESGAYKNKLPYPAFRIKGKDSKQDLAARAAYRAREQELHREFRRDLIAYLKSMKVPDKYVEKVFEYAYGYSEVFAHATHLVEIFS